MSDVVDVLFMQAKERLDQYLELEVMPYTQNSTRFATTVEAVLSGLKRARQPAFLGNEADKSEAREALASLVRLGLPNMDLDDMIGRLTGPDEYQESLEAMAHTVAYFCVRFQAPLSPRPHLTPTCHCRLPRRRASGL